MDIRKTSLRNQLNFVILFVLSLTFLGSVWINVNNTRTFIAQQLEAHAQDTATSLGLSLGDLIIEEDEYSIHASINAIFDRGFFKKIILEKPKGGVRYKREVNELPENVPTWFINLFPLEAPLMKTMIDTGWTIGGALYVQAHPGLAYQQLWQSALDSVHTTLVIFVFALLLGYIILQQVYKPIQAVSEQAKAVSLRQFDTIDNIPHTKELRAFVLAMNQMVTNVKSTFHELTVFAEKAQKAAYEDSKTGLPNRQAFNNRITDLLSKESDVTGYLIMIRFNVLQDVNKQSGYEAGDSLVDDISSIVKTELKKSREAELYRTSGSELIVVVPNRQIDILEESVSNMMSSFKTVELLKPDSFGVYGIGIGAVEFSHARTLKNTMYSLDMATHNASFETSGYFIKPSDTGSNNNLIQTSSEMKSVILTIIKSHVDCIKIKTQATSSLGKRETYHKQIFAFFVVEGVEYNTADIFSSASNYGLTAKLDVAILNSVIRNIGLLNAGKKGKIAVSISKETLYNLEAINNIRDLLAFSGIANTFVVESTENAVLSNVDSSILAIDKLKQVGCSFCINRFGSSMQSLTYLMQIKPNMVKFDSAYTGTVEQLEQNKILISTIVNMAHGINIPVMAQRVESAQQLELLKHLNIDAAQGYFVDKPTLVM
ncbi:EAL domain-containing protein [Algibacillus agarilyticus]|uniref:EAL domain-containing protein n=1 Tax=Algibacillus agarilyticus TaxID=2234133 RepID=UPI000DCFE0D8|nr:LapD/MoxY N-terminal periplasmic domain-containing protein [Algibacillus agarilyticus]